MTTLQDAFRRPGGTNSYRSRRNDDNGSPQALTYLKSWLWRRKAPLALLIFIVVFAYNFIDHVLKEPILLLTSDQLVKLSSTPGAALTTTDRQLRIFLPADGPNVDLCKTLTSTVALGYPLPTLLNWGGEFNRPTWNMQGSHIAKLESLLSVINELLDRNEVTEDDLAILVDAHDVWFQLPPSILIERYHQLVEEADQRWRKQWEGLQGAKNFPVRPPTQQIVVTSAKHCSPTSSSGSDPHYEHWPASPMPDDLFGPDTDTVPWTLDPARKYRFVRPRCVNSGFIMGTMGSLRKALIRAGEKAQLAVRKGRSLWSDQALLGEVIGDQEMWREWMTAMAASWNGTHSSTDALRFDKPVRSVIRQALAGKEFDFGITLDYNFTTVPPTCSAEEEAYFVNLDDADMVKHESEKAGVPSGAVRVKGVPADLREQKVMADSLRDVKWGEVPLFSDFYFGNTPAGVHHNAYVDDMKRTRRREWWSKMWFYPRLRELVQANLEEMEGRYQRRKIAELPMRDDGGGNKDDAKDKGKGKDKKKGSKKEKEKQQPTRYYDKHVRAIAKYEPRKEGQRARFLKMSWDDVCQAGPIPWHEVIFGDGKGGLHLPWEDE